MNYLSRLDDGDATASLLGGLRAYNHGYGGMMRVLSQRYAAGEDPSIFNQNTAKGVYVTNVIGLANCFRH